jgi:HTH-type transcriptional regulator, sugar sensing transcriptional regulator
MIVNQAFMSKLKDFGLNSYEIKIWTALLSRGVSSAGELSDISNVPRSRAYDVLESLEKKGFIIMKIGKPIKYIAVPPAEVIDRVKNDIHENAQGRIELIEEIKNDNVLNELNLLFNQGVEVVDPTDLSGALKSRDNIYQNLNQMIKGAEKSIIIMTTSDGLNRKSQVLRRNLEKASKRGVSIQIAAPINKESDEAINLLKEIAEIKHIEDVSARFVIVDGKQVTFNLMNDSTITPAFDAGIWVNTEFFAGALQSMFDSVWQKQKETVSVQ